MTTKRVVTGAHYGLKDWIGQRVSAVVFTAYVLWLVVAGMSLPRFDHSNWTGLFMSPFARVFTLLAVFALMYHAYVGMRDIWMDYVKPVGLRFALQVATALLLTGYALWAVVILWRF